MKTQVMRSALLFALLLCVAAVCASAQQNDSGQTVLTVRSNLVEVPVLVKTKSGQVVYELTANDFLLTDDGVPQKLTLDPDTDSQPLALAIVVQTGGAGARHLADYYSLDAILDALIGNVDHRVAVIGFDSTPHLLQPFTPNTDDASRQIANLQEGDPGAAILDGVAFAVTQLRTQPARYRRAILLLSETIDQDSKTTLDDALRLISDTNTTMYSFAFSSTHSAVSHEASKFSYGGTTEIGPQHGCFSHDGANAEYDGHYSKQVLDCISQLAPPVRLATLAFVGARNSLHTNTAEAIAQLTGGEFVHFHNAKDLQQGLIAVSHDVPNYYVLSFHPETPAPGIHKLHVELKDRPQLELKSRGEYWIDGDTADIANPAKSP
ncbi:MAG TPA: VWA domain-containing protein [Pseudacidobacterium sp.]|nr:VWA domain-containing protein [Pseudacidobacterium sp.]